MKTRCCREQILQYTTLLAPRPTLCNKEATKICTIEKYFMKQKQHAYYHCYIPVVQENRRKTCGLLLHIHMLEYG